MPTRSVGNESRIFDDPERPFGEWKPHKDRTMLKGYYFGIWAPASAIGVSCTRTERYIRLFLRNSSSAVPVTSYGRRSQFLESEQWRIPGPSEQIFFHDDDLRPSSSSARRDVKGYDIDTFWCSCDLDIIGSGAVWPNTGNWVGNRG